MFNFLISIILRTILWQSMTTSLSFLTFVKFITINLLSYTYSCSKYFTLANVNLLQIINNNSPSSQIIISSFDDQMKRKWHLQAKKEDWYLLDLDLLKNIFSKEECLTDSSIMVLIGPLARSESFLFVQILRDSLFRFI